MKEKILSMQDNTVTKKFLMSFLNTQGSVSYTGCIDLYNITPVMGLGQGLILQQKD